jgi:signal peptidase I
MNFDFELLLTLITIISGLACLMDALVFARKRQQGSKMPLWAEYARSFFPILLVVLLLRSFFAEPYRIPSGSDKPTLLVGDFLVANKFAYGLRLPVLHTKIISVGEPQLGDIMLLRYPVDPSMDFIKRVVGTPGDHISYINKELYINGKPATQTVVGTATDESEDGTRKWPVEVREEDLNGIKHLIYINPDVPAQDFSVVVPPNQYFAMGDNRDDSNDSRYWGFVPEENLVGKAFAIWFSWNNDDHSIRWNRMGTLIH